MSQLLYTLHIMNEKQAIPGEKSMKIPPFYTGGCIVKPWVIQPDGEARHNVNPIISGGTFE